MNKKLTIIIPTYNVEKYILTALNSIKNQQNCNPNDYEVLIVDDGSKDNTKNIIHQWLSENKLDSFKYILKSNGNWGSVINHVKNNNLITGEYVTILDADDWFENNCFSKIFEIIDIKNPEIIISNFYRGNQNKKKKTKVMFRAREGFIAKKRSFTAWSIPMCKFFKTSLFLSLDNLREGVSYQDQILFHSLVLKSNSIYFVNKCLGTYYENREGSSTTEQWNLKRINLWCNNMNKLLSLNSKEIAAYVMMMIDHCYKMSSKELKNNVLINKEYIKLFKSSKFYWVPFGTRWIAKLIFIISTKKIIKNSLK